MSLWTRINRSWRGSQTPTHPTRSQHARLELESLEDRCLPSTTILTAVGAGAGGLPEVALLFSNGTHRSFLAFDKAFSGGVSVVLGHVNGNVIPDVIVGAGSGGGPEVEVFDGA